ncbi:hypothetical protein [Natronobeatus ordinarius]|uniref:hypothetical protein n=1 Tax=Natronobeatus ordinarius TaxID=2963433 RepID=UPI0020CFA0F5|nr:hypothetical protein [Natronobeatus ordinarius]
MKEGLSSFARNAEANEEFDVAAAAFFALGAYTLADEMYRNGRYYREGIGTLLRSVELDTRCGNADRARRTADYLRSNIGPITADGNDPVVRGLGREWAADSLLMTGDETAITEYQTALKLFHGIDFDTELYWGASPEYDTAFLPMKRFFERHRIDYFSDHDVDFAGRVAWKVATAEKVLR